MDSGRDLVDFQHIQDRFEGLKYRESVDVPTRKTVTDRSKVEMKEEVKVNKRLSETLTTADTVRAPNPVVSSDVLSLGQ